MGLELPSLLSSLFESSNVCCRRCNTITWSPVCTLCSKLECNRQNSQAKCSPFREACYQAFHKS